MSSTKYVLVVEDDTDIREVIKEALSIVGVESQTASNGEEGIEKLKKSDKPSLILLDLMMPKTDGVWFCKERMKYPEFLDIPVVILSADGQAEGKTKGLEVSGVLKKPIKIDDLFKTVNAYLQK